MTQIKNFKHPMLGQSKWLLDTPCLVIDRVQLLQNITRMQQYCNINHIGFRPHAKTHKCVELCKAQISAGAIGICVAKVSEAAVLSENNIPGILITSPVVTKFKIQVLMRCLQQTPDVMVVVDSLANAKELNAAAKNIHLPLNVLIDIDSGIGRTGVRFNDAVSLAESILQLPYLRFQGIQCYAGNLQHISSFAERKQASLKIMNMASDIVDELKQKSIPCHILTGSGTGTYHIDTEAKNVTEVQAGSYAVMDMEYAEIEGENAILPNESFNHALTLLTTVISSNRQEHVTVDAGWKALYVNEYKPKVISHSGLLYEWGGFGDEHGKIRAEKNANLPGTGDILELIVPHCDPTINLFDHFFIIENNSVVDVWDIDLRGKSQ